MVNRGTAANSQIVLLGASNLTRGISTVVETAGMMCGTPLQMYAALGHGRSYGQPSSVLGRRLPGILDCGIWKALRDSAAGPVQALVTDIGNDLLYGASPAMISDWVDQCLVRLLDHNAGIVMTLLPLEGLRSLSTTRYVILRSLLFPRCRLDLDTMAGLARQLDDRLQRLGRLRGVRLVRPDTHWYGLDPIHVRIRHWRDAWQTILQPWNPSLRAPRYVAGSLRRWFYLRTRVPQQCEVWGWQLGQEQPSGALPDGSTVAFF
jgi:hypothetical protein